LTGSFGSSERTGKREDPQTRSSGDKHSIRAHSAESRNPRSSSSSDNHQTQNSDNKPYITRFDFGIAGSQSTIKSFVALVQLFSIIRILRANTLEDYGAYQLTLIPYALMSFVNIISSFFTPSYPAVYMVRSTVMEEAERRGGVFDGWIGILDEGGEVTMRHTTVDHGMMAEPGLSIDLDAVEGQEPWKDPSKREGPEQSKDPKADELPKLPKDPPTGEPLSPSESLITGEPFNPGEPLTIVEPLTANKPQSPGDLGRAGGAELKKQPIISFGRFWDATELRRGTYFHHLKRTLPFIRFIRLTLKQNTETSQQIFGNVFNDYITESRDPSKYYFVLQIGNAKHRAAAKKWMPLFMDIFMIVALAVPWVTIYFLTKFKAPKGHVHGVFFMLWLLLGQLLPFLLVPSWSLINLKIWRIKLNKAILVSSMCVSLTAFAAFGGFYFVGRLRYQELAQNNNNCSKSQTTPALYELATDCN
jgi:hypothetical protein